MNARRWKIFNFSIRRVVEELFTWPPRVELRTLLMSLAIFTKKILLSSFALYLQLERTIDKKLP